MSALLSIAAIVGAVVAVDLMTKAAAGRLPASGLGHRSLGLRRVVNRRGSLLGVGPGIGVGLLVAAAFGAALVSTLSVVGTTSAVACGLLLGGATANLVNRLRSDGVVDFVIIGRWPPFNLADVALVGGAVLLPAAVLA